MPREGSGSLTMQPVGYIPWFSTDAPGNAVNADGGRESTVTARTKYWLAMFR